MIGKLKRALKNMKQELDDYKSKYAKDNQVNVKLEQELN